MINQKNNYNNQNFYFLEFYRAENPFVSDFGQSLYIPFLSGILGYIQRPLFILMKDCQMIGPGLRLGYNVGTDKNR